MSSIDKSQQQRKDENQGYHTFTVHFFLKDMFGYKLHDKNSFVCITGSQFTMKIKRHSASAIIYIVILCPFLIVSTVDGWKKYSDSPEKRVHNRRSQYWNKNYAISLSTLRPTFISTICHRNPLRRLCNNESSTHNNTYATHIWEYHGFQK